MEISNDIQLKIRHFTEALKEIALVAPFGSPYWQSCISNILDVCTSLCFVVRANDDMTDFILRFDPDGDAIFLRVFTVMQDEMIIETITGYKIEEYCLENHVTFTI